MLIKVCDLPRFEANFGVAACFVKVRVEKPEGLSS